RADLPLERKREVEKRQHVEQQVAEVRVHEAAHDDRAELAPTQEPIRSEQAAVDELRSREQADEAGGDRYGEDHRRAGLLEQQDGTSSPRTRYRNGRAAAAQSPTTPPTR